MNIHIYSIVGLWLISYLIEEKMPTSTDIEDFIKSVSNMKFIENTYLELVD